MPSRSSRPPPAAPGPCPRALSTAAPIDPFLHPWPSFCPLNLHPPWASHLPNRLGHLSLGALPSLSRASLFSLAPLCLSTSNLFWMSSSLFARIGLSPTPPCIIQTPSATALANSASRCSSEKSTLSSAVITSRPRATACHTSSSEPRNAPSFVTFHPARSKAPASTLSLPTTTVREDSMVLPPLTETRWFEPMLLAATFTPCRFCALHISHTVHTIHHLPFPTLPFAIPYVTIYQTIHSHLPYHSLPFARPYIIMYHTVHYHLPYHTLPFTITIPYITIYKTKLCHLPFHPLPATISTLSYYTLPYHDHTVHYHTKHYHPIHCHTIRYQNIPTMSYTTIPYQSIPYTIPDQPNHTLL